MASIMRIKAKWTGYTGAPGYSNFYFREFGENWATDATADAAADRVETFLGALLTLFPPALRVAVQSDAELLEETDGKLISVFNAGLRNTYAGSAVAAGYSAASGAVITWRSNGVVAGRRARGRTFLVPLASAAYASGGDLSANTLTTISNAATALAAGTGSPDLGVWSRPHEARVNKAGTAIPAREGVWHAVTSVTVPSKVAVLRSRRD